ncbi:PREDICTED: F-box/SPRY domain-containing protein 1-like [Rhagoletis zephyria]|uniref:F-box/SPRY domain-containing protein 1-like n=1 Tax=Rhagoletis zephyria TaxID=28612 RepID=UPI0008114C96|nr:PREDICTED: F-box/SPRY domain-containing protein 1-like [Rhagoletis zephyria]
MLVCKKWYYALSDDRSEIWAIFAGRRLSKAVLKSPVLYSLPSYKAKLRALSYAWDAAECSRNIFIKPNGFTLHRNPVAQSTDAARGKLGLTAGRHCWEVCWEGPLGTVAVVGVATKEATLQAAGYVPLIGSNVHSWGWNLVENSLIHGGHCTGAYPRLANAPRYQTGDRLRIILDCDSQTLAFERDYEFLGIAFFSLPKKPLYPAVSAVYGNTEISMVYLGWPLDG